MAIKTAYHRFVCVCKSEVVDPSSDCESQVQRYLTGGQGAKEDATFRIQERFKVPITGVARTILQKLLGKSILDDAVQEVWRNVFGRTGTGEPQLLNWINRPVHEPSCPCNRCRGPFCAWLLKTARNASLTIYRRESVRVQLVKPLPDGVPTEDSKASDERDRLEKQEEVQWCLKRLSEDDQRLYEWIFVEGKKPPECAAILGIKERAFFFRQRQLLDRFQRLLEQARRQP